MEEEKLITQFVLDDFSSYYYVVGKAGNQTAPCPTEDESGDALKKL